MILEISFEDISKWVSLFANIATCITALTAIGALVSAIVYFKNRPSNKNFQITFKVRNSGCSNNEKDIYTRLHCSIDVSNFTDKEFSIIECNLICNKKRYIMEELFQVFPKGQLWDFRPLKNISLYAHQSITLSNVYFRIPKSEINKAILEVKTTQKTLKYKVSLEEQDS